MLKNFYRLLVLMLVILIGLAASADARLLKGKSRIEIAGGQWLNKDGGALDIYWNDCDDDFEAEGAIGSITFSNWQQENMAMLISYSGMDYRETGFIDDDGYFFTEKTMVHSLLFGMRFYPNQASRYISWHPFLSVEAGPYFGFTNYTDVGDIRYYKRNMHHATTAMGVRLGGGIDIELSRHFMVGMNGGYNFISDFDEMIGDEYNVSGGDVRFSISLLLGGRRGR